MTLLETAQTATTEILTKLREGGWRLPMAGALPAGLLICLCFWFTEIYAASVGLWLPQLVATFFCVGIGLVLVALILARMSLELMPDKDVKPFGGGFHFRAEESRTVGAVALYVVMGAALAACVFFSDQFVSRAFFVAGSEPIAQLVAAVGRTMFILTGIYVFARGSLLLSSAVRGAPGPGEAWSATDEDATLLLILVWFAPATIFMLTGGVALYLAGAWDFSGAPALEVALQASTALKAYWWFILPVVWASLLVAFSVMSASLAIAHERLIPEPQSGNAAGTPPIDEHLLSE